MSEVFVSHADILRFLKGFRLGVVSTVDVAGAPQSAVVGIATSELGEVVFDTLGTSRKAQNLRRVANVSLVVWQDERTLQLDGVADEPAGTERERLLEVYLDAYPDGRERLSWPDLTHFRIRPRWVRYSDFAQEPPLIVELDWRAPTNRGRGHSPRA